MNVLHLSTAISWRGGEQQVDYLLQSLTPYVENQYLLCVKNSELAKRVGNAEIIELPKPKFIDFKWIRIISEISEKYKIDVIQVHESKVHTYAVVSSILYSIPPILVTRRVIFSVKGILSKFKYRHSSVKKIICISNAVKDEMNKIVTSSKLEVIPSVVAKQNFVFAHKKHFNFLEDSKIKIANVSALTPEKDIKTFIKTAKELLKERTDLQFYIVGEGKQELELKAYVKALNLEKDVIFVGFIKDIKQLILQLDLLLFTSKSEGLGTTIIDFFLANKPVVATDAQGVRDLIINNQTGLLCEVGDVIGLKEAVLKILQNENFKNKLITKAMLLAEKNHSIQNLGINYYTVYKQVKK